jgi:hypothetical protein
MIINTGDIVKCFGQFRMKLTPYLVKDKDNNIIKDESKAQITMYDISQKFDILWSTTMKLNEAHGALTMFEMIGYYNAPINVN